jgi:hypothetical protein
LHLFLTNSRGLVDASWIVEAGTRQSFWSGALSLCSGFMDVLKDDTPACNGGPGQALGGSTWQHQQCSMQRTKEQEDAEVDRRDTQEIKQRLAALVSANHVCLTWLRLTACSNLLNILFSAVLIWHYYYLDYRSFTVLLTNVVAVSKMIASHMAVLSDPHHVLSTATEGGRRVTVSVCLASLVKSQQLFFNRLDKTDVPACC